MDNGGFRESPLPSLDEPYAQPSDGKATLTRVLLWAGVATLSAALAYSLVRARWRRRSADPTSERIQQLIEEANQLLRTLDEPKLPPA